jgi:lipoprotein-releasing system permease protein
MEIWMNSSKRFYWPAKRRCEETGDSPFDQDSRSPMDHSYVALPTIVFRRKLSFEFYILKRYIRSKRQGGFISLITFIGMVGVALGVAALIIALTILGGFEREIKQKVFGFAAHIQVVGFQNQSLPDYEQALETIRKEIPGVKAASPVVSREVILRAKGRTEGVLMKGVDEATDVSSTRNQIVEGRYDLESPNGPPKLILGRKLAQRLGVKVGDHVVLFGIGGNLKSLGTPIVRQFIITGIYETGMAEYDDIYVYTSIRAAQELLHLDGFITGIEVLVDDLSRSSTIAAQIQNLLGYPYYARTVQQLYRNLFSWIELQKKPTPIVLGLIIVVATVNIIGTLLMVVMEKTHQIGILKSMGASSGAIRKIFIGEGLVIGVVGTVLGNVLAYGLSTLQLREKLISLPEQIYFMSSVPILLRVENFLIVSLIAMALCFLATLVPASLAAKLEPVRAIRFA